MVKKILIIGLTNIMGGVETFIRNTTLYSDRDQVQFYFLVHGSKECLFQNEICNFYKKDSFYFLPRFKSRPIKTILSLRKFYKEHHDFDFIHLETGAASEIVYCYPYAKKYGIKLIIHSHNGGNLHSFIAHQLFIPLINRIVDIRLACSQVAAKYMFGKKYARNTCIIPVGIDIDKFRYSPHKRETFRCRYGIKENQLVIGSVGRFTKQKNQKYALKIFTEILSQSIDGILILKGQGELEEELRAFINKADIIDKVHIINQLDDMDELYCGLDIFLMPSLFEGLPQVAVEAQASGLPCFFSDTISRETDLTGNNMFLNLEDSYAIWADRIIAYQGRVIDRNEGYRLVKERGYDIHDTVKKLETIYLAT